MNRQQMLAILNSMSDDKLMEAMSATGIPMDEDRAELGMEDPNTLEGWNARDVSMPDPQKPVFFDKSKFQKPPMQAARPYMAGASQPDSDLAAWLPQQADGTV